MARLTATLKEVATFNPRLGAKLIQISETYYKIINNRKRKYALFQCESCLEKFERRVDNVGKKCVICHNIEIAKLNSYVNNKRIHNIWAGLKARTSNNKHRDWNKYGAKGIFICEEWKDYKIFEKWALNNGYDSNLSIDRINTYKGYSPDNCRWTDCLTQSANTRLIHKTNKTGFRGVCIHKGRYRASIQVNKKHISLGRTDCAIKAAYLYDEYVISNKLENPTNLIPK